VVVEGNGTGKTWARLDRDLIEKVIKPGEVKTGWLGKLAYGSLCKQITDASHGRKQITHTQRIFTADKRFIYHPGLDIISELSQLRGERSRGA
jgi:hypothetical protein